MKGQGGDRRIDAARDARAQADSSQKTPGHETRDRARRRRLRKGRARDYLAQLRS